MTCDGMPQRQQHKVGIVQLVSLIEGVGLVLDAELGSQPCFCEHGTLFHSGAHTTDSTAPYHSQANFMHGRGLLYTMCDPDRASSTQLQFTSSSGRA